MIKRYRAGIICIMLLLLTGCAKAKESSIQFTAMDTFMTMTVYDKDQEKADEVLAKAKAMVLELDDMLSAKNPSSEVAELNNRGRLRVPLELQLLIERSIDYSRLTRGAFDISIYPLVSLWGFGDEPKVPSEESIAKSLKLIDYQRIAVDAAEQEITLGEGQRIDLGAIAKGYAADEVAGYLNKYGIKSGLISLGGNIYALGKKPDGSRWNIAIADPREEKQGYLCTILAENEAVVSSGGYLRNFKEDGKVYHHILDPKTGYPAGDYSCSVSIVSKDSTLADALSTGCFVLGREKAFELWEEHRDEFSIIWFEEGKLYVTPDIRDRITPVNAELV